MIRTRFAPSPTGLLHVGGLRTALYNYIFAKQNNGEFILRIEDTDQNRKIQNADKQIIKSLKYFDIDFNEGPDKNEKYGPYTQSERLSIYKKHYIELIKNKKAYVCMADGDNLIPEFNVDIAMQKIETEEYVVKFAINSDKVIEVNDELRGVIKFDLSLIEDPIIIKSDGFPTYHFANVIDDYYMKISHVIRGEEWISSLPKHVLLYESFNWEIPKFIHLPLLLNPDKSKLSKRQSDVHVENFLDKGYLKEAIINFIALLGWHPSGNNELFDLDYLVKNFSLKRVQKAGAVFDIKKLNWMNSVYIKNLSVEDLIDLFNSTSPMVSDFNFSNKTKLTKVFKFIKNRINTLDEIPGLLNPFYKAITIDNQEILDYINMEDSNTIFKYWYTNLSEINQANKEYIDKLIEQTGDKFGLKGKKIFFPLRAILYGSFKGPDLFTIISILGVEETKVRIKKYIK